MTSELPWRSNPDLVRWAAATYGDAEAVVDTAEDGSTVRWSFQELADRVVDAARAFVAAGIEPGDRVAIWAPNVHEWIVAVFGLQSAGGVLVPLNTRYKGTEAAFILDKSRARILVTVNGFLDFDYVSMLRSCGDPLPHLEQIVVLRGDMPDGCVSWSDFLATGAGVDPAEVERRIDSLGPDDLADILFTSGTTGSPKGVICRHGQGLRGFRSWSEVVGLRAGDRYLIVNPFFHAFGYKAGLIASLIRGATMIPQPVFDVPQIVQRVVDERVTMLPGPPTVYQTILNHPDRARFDLSSLRLAVTGAAKIPVSLVEQMWEVLGFETVVTGYGLTEASGIATMCRHDDDAVTIATTSGRAIDDVEVRVVDDGGTEVPRGTPGEIWVRGYNVMEGYFEEPEQTAATITADGWLKTGDIGVMDERGYIDITDRKKDMFISGGFNAYPAEIEAMLVEHPDIAQVAVVGVPDERMGEVGVAFVVATSGTTPDPAQITSWARERMANFKVPRHVRIVDALPLNPSGKVLKYQLRDAALADVPTPSGAT